MYDKNTVQNLEKFRSVMLSDQLHTTCAQQPNTHACRHTHTANFRIAERQRKWITTNKRPILPYFSDITGISAKKRGCAAVWLIIPLHYSDVWICVHRGSLARRLLSITNRTGRVYNGKGSMLQRWRGGCNPKL